MLPKLFEMSKISKFFVWSNVRANGGKGPFLWVEEKEGIALYPSWLQTSKRAESSDLKNLIKN